MKQYIFKSIYLLTLIFSVIAVSCVDDFPYRNDDIPEGEGILSATVTFTPVRESNLGPDTRTPGDAINSIESLCVLVYDETKTQLLYKYTQSNLYNYKTSESNVEDLKDYDGTTDETKTATASFQLLDLPYGKYYIFAVANMGDLSAYDDEIKTVEGLQNIQLKWDPEFKDGQNKQMFGYFTPDGNMVSTGFEPDTPLTFTGKIADSKIHAWLKRAASKVTVAFDPSGLNQGVTIYVRSVTLRDIPKTCYLGKVNTPAPEDPEGEDGFYNHLSSYADPDYQNPTAAVANSRLWYNAKGVSDTEPEKTPTAGLRLDNSVRSALPANAHGVNAASLFFYENNQNPYLEKIDQDYKNDKNNNKYNKQPQKTGDDKIGSIIHAPENDNDFKDRVPNGTYVEVEAYYTSSNPANPGEGTIKYRFMLGKDTSFDYNAERNFHYKLTLGFNGWANDPDWHIDYVITNPDIEVPSVFRVSYLYLQKSELPIRIIGDIQYLTVTITENNWAPYDPNTASNQTITLGSGINQKQYQVPQGVVATTPSTYQFQWNEAAFINSVYLNPASSGSNYPDNLPEGQQRPQFGFLALHLPSRETTTIKNGHSEASNNALIEYWKNHLEGERRFAKDNDGYEDFTIGEHTASWGDRGHDFPVDDNKYTVNPIKNDNNVEIENQRILMLPLWTRTKTLIETSGFSGNNPYEAFERKAVLHIAGSFKVGNETQRIEKDVEVYQVKRITNPKGVWRAHDRTETFNVTLLEAVNSNAESDFQAFTSQGEWTAFIDQETNAGGFTLRPNGETNGYMENGVIHGNTGSTINFAINFGNKVEENQSECAVIKVLYHGNQCMHKILVRKGYNAPLRMGDNSYTTSTGSTVKGKLWSSFSLYRATDTKTTEGGRQVFDAVLTKNPLMLGSMFRRGQQDKGIFVWNNQQPALAPFLAPGDIPFIIGEKKDESTTINPNAIDEAWRNQWKTEDWTAIDFRNDLNTTNNLGTFYALDDNGNYSTDDNGSKLKYRVPTFDEFQDLTEASEFGFGVFYGSSATEPQTDHDKAYGLIDPFNQGLFDSKNGMRAVVAYDKTNGNQILFPMGRYGIGVRRMYQYTRPNATYNGLLRYADVYNPLVIRYGTDGKANGNLYRPIPYNLPIVSGNIYWIDQYVPSGTPYGDSNLTDPCLGWDMNYFNFDFNPYTANNWQDACQIKFVIDE